MNGMDDWNVRRKARGRIKRARRRRQRQRATALAILLLLCTTVFALGTVNYGAKKHRALEIEQTQRTTYALPRIQPLAAVAQQEKPDELPQMLNIRERFPDYGEGGRPEEPPSESSGGEDELASDEAPRRMVILDDLRAAPPKSMFVRAVFENIEEEYKPKKPRKWLWRDHDGDYDDIWGRKGKKKKKKMPPIPEPGTGLLLGLGLTMLSEGRRRHRRRSATTERKG